MRGISGAGCTGVAIDTGRTLNTRLKLLRTLLSVAACAFVVDAACGQPAPNGATVQTPSSLMQRADTASPRDTLFSFLNATNELYELLVQNRYIDLDDPNVRAIAMRVVDCLDTSQFPEYARVELSGETAIHLKEILDRIELPPVDEIP
ncbi:MAG: hypothetical protein AAF961_17415, partial [Planctomycetota bacterium]